MREMIKEKLSAGGFTVKDATKYSMTNNLCLHSIEELCDYVLACGDKDQPVVLGDVVQSKNVYSFFTKRPVITISISFCEVKYE